MNPRQVRDALRRGELTAVDPRMYKSKPPEPPGNWAEWRRERMRVAVRAAIMFLQGKGWKEISQALESAGMLVADRVQRKGSVITKARVQQYIKKGVDFLISRGCFREVREK